MTGQWNWFSRLAIIAAAAAVAVFAHAPAHASPWGKDYLPNVEVIDQDGRPLKFYDDLLKGKIVVISFVYTSCKSICPLTLARLRDVQDMLGDAMGREIHFISVSIDPIPDTPEKLKEYASAFKVAKGWAFVTGDIANIDLIRYKLGERSGSAIAQHKNEVLMFNDATGEWSRDSPFNDLSVLTTAIRSMDPAWRAPPGPQLKSVALETDRRTQRELPGQSLFIKACASCHSLGKAVKVGPGLQGLAQRRDLAWIRAYLTGPDKLRAAKDPTAMDLQRAFPGVRMPNLGLSKDDVDDLMIYIEAGGSGRAAATTARTNPAGP